MCLELYVGSNRPIPLGHGLHAEQVPESGEIAEVLATTYIVAVSLDGGCACDLMGEGEDVTPEAHAGRQALAQMLEAAASSDQVVFAGSFGGDHLRGVRREAIAPTEVVGLDWEWGWASPRIFDVAAGRGGGPVPDPNRTG